MRAKMFYAEKIKNSRNSLWIFVLGLLILITQGCSTLQLESHWRDSEIVIDGQSNDWIGRLMFMDNPNLSLGLQNDDRFLYICLIAEDQSVRNRIAIRGMTLWFDSEGGKAKTYGITFPIGRQETQRNPRKTMNFEEKRDPEQMRERAQASLDEVEIKTPGRQEPVRIDRSELKGIEIAFKNSSGLAVYEVKIPLQDNQDSPFFLDTLNGSQISVGLEVPKMEISQRPAGMGGRDSMGGGMGGRGGVGGGMSGRGSLGGRTSMGGQMADIQKGIKIWAAVQLASTKEQAALR